MNLDELVAWGQHTLGYLDEPHPLAGLPVDSAALQSKLGWLADYRAALEEWRQTMATISATLSYIRHEGYHRGAAPPLRPLLVTCARSAMSRRIAARLIHFVRQQSAAACQAEQLIGSSECLESLIGKGKRLEGQQSKSGFTKMVLAMAAAVAKPTKDYIPRAGRGHDRRRARLVSRPLGCFGAIPTPPSLRRNRNRNGINEPRSLPLILRSPPLA